jgi:DNA replication and repair protein RecF
MFLQSLTLQNFRNYSYSQFEFNPQLTIIIGPNARGKTNILESVFFILNGTGFRESREDELITFGEGIAAVTGQFKLENDILNLQIMLRHVNNTVEKIYTINKVKKRGSQYQQETTRSILFSPDQISIITGSPEDRRSYVDRVISFYDIEYKKRLTNYEHGLRKRNKVLEFYRSEETLKEELSFWNTYLTEQALYVTSRRAAYIDFLNKNNFIDTREFRIEYIKNEFNIPRLEHIYETEKKYRKSLIGPQKDDFRIYKVDKEDKQDVHHFGSRSEQRLAIFWLHICEVKYCESYLKKRPIILLDDIFSELDTGNKKLIMTIVKEYQTILTTTEEEILELTKVERSIIEL